MRGCANLPEPTPCARALAAPAPVHRAVDCTDGDSGQFRSFAFSSEWNVESVIASSSLSWYAQEY